MVNDDNYDTSWVMPDDPFPKRKKAPGRDRLTFSEVLYWSWNLISALMVVSSIWAGPILGNWDVFLGLIVAAVAFRAHARLERLDGHRHDRGDVNVPR